MQYSTLYTLVFAAVVCLICSVLVSGSAVVLRARQEQNAMFDKQQNVLVVAGLVEPGERLSVAEVRERFEGSIRERLVDLATGDYPADEAQALEDYDLAKALADPALSSEAPANPARVLRVPNYARVYQVMKGEQVDRYVLPVTGKGLWSTLNGLLAIDADGATIRAITFYEHAETPGLGGEVDNPEWKALWDGRAAFDNAGQPAIKVVKGRAKGPSEVDGLSGATLTSRGVTNLVQFWLGGNGFGPYLAKIRQQGSSA